MVKVIAARKLVFKGKEIQALVQVQGGGDPPKVQIVIISFGSNNPNTLTHTHWEVKPCTGFHETTRQKAIRRLNAITPEKANEWLERQEAKNARRAKGQRWVEENTPRSSVDAAIHS